MICKICGVQYNYNLPEWCKQCTIQAVEIMQRERVEEYVNSVVQNNELLNIDDENFLVLNGILLQYRGNSLNVTIPDDVTHIGDRVFKYKQVTTLFIPNSVTHIGALAFQETPWYANLREKYVIVGDQILLKYNGRSKKPSIPNGVKSIAYHAFMFHDLIAVTIPDSVTNIGDGAFSQNQLNTVTIPNSMISIAWAAFTNNQLTTVNIPDSVTEIGGCAFMYNNLSRVTIPASVTSIGTGAFLCNPLQSIRVDQQEGSIEDSPWGATTNGAEDGLETPIYWNCPRDVNKKKLNEKKSLKS